MASLAIRSFTYDVDRNELRVEYTNGRSYLYSLVPAQIVAALEAARSKGAFVNQHIRDRYPFRKETGRQATGSKPAQPSLLEALKESCR